LLFRETPRRFRSFPDPPPLSYFARVVVVGFSVQLCMRVRVFCESSRTDAPLAPMTNPAARSVTRSCARGARRVARAPEATRRPPRAAPPPPRPRPPGGGRSGPHPEAKAAEPPRRWRSRRSRRRRRRTRRARRPAFGFGLGFSSRARATTGRRVRRSDDGGEVTVTNRARARTPRKTGKLRKRRARSFSAWWKKTRCGACEGDSARRITTRERARSRPRSRPRVIGTPIRKDVR